MYLQEYQVKRMLSNYGFLVPKNFFCRTIEEIRDAFYFFEGQKFVLKCQIQFGGRGKSGAVKVVSNIQESELFFRRWMNRKLATDKTGIDGQKVVGMLVEEYIDVQQEMYVSVSIDKNKNRIVLIFSFYGGIEVEKNHEKNRNYFQKLEIDLIKRLKLDTIRRYVDKLCNIQKISLSFSKFLFDLLEIFFSLDLLFIEINPIAIDRYGKLICLDGKSKIDENALFREKEIKKEILSVENDSLEDIIDKLSISSNYVSLNGNIGCISNGAGLAMGLMDLIKIYGGHPANFLDIGGNTSLSKVEKYFCKILNQDRVIVVIVNVFGGIIRCDVVAQILLRSMKKIGGKPIPKIFVRFSGNRYQYGINMLKESCFKSNISIMYNLEEMVEKSVLLTKGRNVHFN
ncbi:ATP-grasp domain-containing protein [Candidatus Riesia pediculischaeffi]|nr:ATP-grasp domain-containing protein [Candidatus Riesia pediculischaeffi]